MSASLDQPSPFYSEPGPDMRPRTVDEVADELIAVITADRQITPEETRAIQRVLSVLQATADGVEALLPAARRGGPNMGAFGLGGGMYPINGGASPDPDEVDVGEEPQGPQGGMGNYAFAGAPPLETFGTSTFREIAAMFMKYLDQKSSEKNAPRVNDIVRSIAQAKLAGLDDVVDRLKLTLNQALEQQEKKADESRTISPDSVVVTESPLPSTPPAALIGL